MDWSPRIVARGRPRGWHRPMAMGMGYPTISVLTPPTLLSLSPSSGAVSTSCTITGLNFGTVQGTSTVTVTGVSATVNSWSATSIGITIPVTATTGSVVVTVGGVGSNALTFTVTGGEAYHYIVQPGASDSGSVGPFATINYAMQVAAGALTGTGKTIAVRGATYDQVVTANVSGTSAFNRIRVTKYAGETVWLQPSASGGSIALLLGQRYLEFDGINCTANQPGAAVVFGDGNALPVEILSDHIRFLNAEIVNDSSPGGSGCITGRFNDCYFSNLNIHGLGGPYAIYITGDRNIVEGCDLHHVTTSGVHVYYASGNPTGNIVRNNIIRDISTSFFFGTPYNELWAIVLFGTSNQAYNNRIMRMRNTTTGSPADGLYFYSGSNNKGWNNTIVNVDNAVRSYNQSGGQAYNNIGWNNDGRSQPGYSLSGGSAVDCQFNSWQSPVNSANPLFVAPGSDNYHLGNGSPCIDRGTSGASLFTTDADGNARPAPGSSVWDQGAYERAP